MKAIALFISNLEEIKQAEKLDLDIPDQILDDEEVVYFRIKEVEIFWKDNDGNIVITMYSQRYTLKFNQEVWNKLVKEFE